MSSALREELDSLTNDQLRSRLLQHGLGNMPVTSSTRTVLLNRLKKAIEGQKGAPRRETMHVTPVTPTAAEEKSASKAVKKPANRRNTMAVPMATEEIVPIPKPKQNVRRSGRMTPTYGENGNAASIAVAPSETDIIELDEDPVPQAYVPPKRTSRSPSLGKSQTVVTSYKTEVSKPTLIVESTEEEEEDDGYDEDDESTSNTVQNNLYPTLPTNGYKNYSPPKTASHQSTLRRTTTHTTAYEPSSYQPRYEQNYRDSPFKAPLSKPTQSTYTSSTSGLNRRYTTAFNSKQRFDDDSATEHSDIDTPYLSDFAKRLSQLRPEPLDRKIIADVKQHHLADNSMWQSFSNLVIAVGSKFGKVIAAGCLLMVVVFIYVFFIMA